MRTRLGQALTVAMAAVLLSSGLAVAGPAAQAGTGSGGADSAAANGSRPAVGPQADRPTKPAPRSSDVHRPRAVWTPPDSPDQYVAPGINSRPVEDQPKSSASGGRHRGTSALTAATVVVTPGAITGTITDSVSGAPVVGACVTAYRSGAGDTDADTYTGCSSSTGSYTFASLPPASYYLYAEDHVSSHQTTDLDGVSVTSGTTTTADIQMRPGGSIAGLITNTTATPLAGVCLSAYQVDGDGHQGGACTEPDGTYQTEGLPAGNYVLYARDYNGPHLSSYYGGSTYSSATPITVTVGSATSGINLSLARGGTISGTVLGSDGSALFGTYVEVRSGDSNVASGFTDVDGAYSTSGIRATGDYIVRFYGDGVFVTRYYPAATTTAGATPVHVVLGADTPGINGTLPLGGSLSGTITAASGGAPIEGACVAAFTTPGSDNGGYGCSDAAGAFTVGGLDTDTYSLRFNGPYLSGYVSQTTTPHSVTLGVAATGKNAAMVIGGTITGRVTQAVGGAPVADACASASPVGGGYLGDGGCADSNGDYSIVGLPAGDFVVEFVAPTYALQYYDNKAAASDATPVAVTLGATRSAVDAALQRSPRVVGNIRDFTTGAGLPGGFAVAFDTNNDYAAYAPATSTGSYELFLPGPGSYKVQFADSDRDYVPTWFGGPTAGTATVLTVVNGQSVPADGDLKRTATISGTVTGAPGGLAVAYAEVEILDSEGTAVSYTVTASNGRYTAQGFEGGTYTVHIYGLPEYLSYESAPTVVAAAGTAVVNAALQRAGTISGRVTVPGGAGLSTGCVKAYEATGGNAYAIVAADCDLQDGNYTVGPLTTGSYVVDFYDYDGEFIREWYDNASERVNADPLSVTLGSDTPGINAELALGGGFSGSITDAATGAPVGGCALAFALPYDELADSVGSGCTDELGDYTVGGLPPGDYIVQFSDFTGEFLSEWSGGQAQAADAETVPVTAGVVLAGVDAALTRVPAGPVLTAASPPDSAVITRAYSYTFTATGSPAPTFAVASGTLPTGLSLNATTGLLSGTATAVAAFSFTVSATNASGTDTSGPIAMQVRFTDVSAGAAFSSDIYWMAANGITTGFADGTFRPGNSVTRQAFAAYLYRYDHGGVSGGPCATGTSSFPDVADTSPFCTDIKWLAATGITGGFSDGTFRPGNMVVRQAVAAFLYRYRHGGASGGPCPTGTSSFPDVADTSPFCTDIKWLATTTPVAITTGFADGTFRPTAVVTRQASAAYFHRYDGNFAP